MPSTSATSIRSQPQRWDSSQSIPASQTSSSKRRRSPNRIKARPANPQVISSILSSFDALETHRSLPVPEQYSRDSSRSGRKDSKGSSARSPDGSFASAPDIPFAPTSMPYPQSSGFGMQYGSTVAVDEAEDESDAALPPIIPTTRSTSAFSNQSTRRPGLTNGASSLRPPSLTSRRSSSNSSFREKERERGIQGIGSKNLSAESWIKQNIQQSLETAQAPKGLVRVSAQETVRPQELNRRGREHLVDYARGYATAGGQASERVAHDSPVSEVRPESKGRLYLDQSDEDDFPPANDTASPQGEVLDSPVSPLQPNQHSSPNTSVSPRISPAKGNIADSIPLRTSSLRQSSSSPAPIKRKAKKAQRQTVADSPFKSKRAEPISDTSFLDLGEDDETVRRIMELRKRRETRLLESTPEIAVPADLDVPASETRGVSPGVLSARIMQEVKSPPRPTAQRVNSAPVKAHKMLGLTIEPPMPDVLTNAHSAVSKSARASPELVRSPASPLSTSNLSQPYSESTSPRLSIDYSYVHAVDSLRHTGANNLPVSEGDRPSIDAAIPKGISLNREILGLPPAVEARSDSSLSYNPQHIKKRGKKSSRDRWTAVEHPDLPPQLERRRSRRKSMSDAKRNAMIHEEELAVQRRDSIEDAVLGFLCAARLNQRIQHPVGGRTISFSEVGDSTGAAVFVCVGMGLTRFVTAFYDELATTLRLRLITIERPGVGGSEPYPQNDRSGPMNWPNDVLLVCEHLKIAKFSLLAHSAGAIYALATALVLPHLVQGKVQLMAPWIPPSQLEAVAHSATSTPPAGALPTSQRILRILPTPFLRAANSSLMTAASSSLKPATKRRPSGTSPRQEQRANSESPARGRPVQRPSTSGGERPDFHRRESMMMMDQYMPSVNPMENFPIPIREVMEEENTTAHMGVMLSATATPTDADFTFASTALNAAEHAERERQVEYTSRLTQRTWEYAIRDSNPATDLLVCLERHREVGFRYTDVNRPVIITHGSEDKRVPVGNVRWLAEQMNRNALGSYRGDNGLHKVSTRDTNRTDFESVGGGGCEVRVLPGEGHGLMASPLIMGDILTEIAGYWREPLML